MYRSVDWSLRVDSNTLCEDVPEPIGKIVSSFGFQFKPHVKADTLDVGTTKRTRKLQAVNLPKWQALVSGPAGNALRNFKVKSSARVQFRDTPYEVCLTVTQKWHKVPTGPKPDCITWSVSVGGINWEEALNERGTNDSSTGPRIDLRKVWPGDGSLKERLHGFLECILETQTGLTELLA